ncbi:MAG: DUF1572 family protein [Cyclobacteriaceae bacterium]|nr:DUF1572 family protein [Cyclobacteriaceae bacterium HetDA_MAG_MS6]
MDIHFLANTLKLAKYYKSLGEKTFDQLSEEQLRWSPGEDSNSIATIVKHLWGNMLSRWTNFLQEDGEKPWRERDAEFENDVDSKDEMLSKWQEGWECFLGALESLTGEDLKKTVYIRNEGHSVVDAIQRQMAHYPYHIGQIVFIGKVLKGSDWKSLSIPKNQSVAYNAEKFKGEKGNKHFTDNV